MECGTTGTNLGGARGRAGVAPLDEPGRARGMIVGEVRAPIVLVDNVRIDRRHAHSREQRGRICRTAGEFLLSDDTTDETAGSCATGSHPSRRAWRRRSAECFLWASRTR